VSDPHCFNHRLKPTFLLQPWAAALTIGMTGLDGNGGSPKNKNAGLVGPAASLLLICVERLVYFSCPRGSF
jgi:hypothetical protein